MGLHDLVNGINDRLKLTFSGSAFQNWECIAEPIRQKTQVKPVIKRGKDFQSVFISKNDTFLVYHRVEGYDPPSVSDGFGGRMTRSQEANMRLVMIADCNKINFSKEEIVQALVKGFPVEFPQSFRRATNINSITITPGSVDVNTDRIWVAEFGDISNILPPSAILIALPYLMSYVPCGVLCE